MKKIIEQKTSKFIHFLKVIIGISVVLFLLTIVVEKILYINAYKECLKVYRLSEAHQHTPQYVLPFFCIHALNGGEFLSY